MPTDGGPVTDPLGPWRESHLAIAAEWRSIVAELQRRGIAARLSAAAADRAAIECLTENSVDFVVLGSSDTATFDSLCLVPRAETRFVTGGRMIGDEASAWHSTGVAADDDDALVDALEKVAPDA